MDDALARTGSAAFAHMPTAYDHQEQSDKDKQPNTLARSTTDWRSARHQSQVAPGSYLNWKRLG
jgi:hypothetical protein